MTPHLTTISPEAAQALFWWLRENLLTDSQLDVAVPTWATGEKTTLRFLTPVPAPKSEPVPVVSKKCSICLGFGYIYPRSMQLRNAYFQEDCKKCQGTGRA